MSEALPRPKKSFGQHFLADKRIAQAIAELAARPSGGSIQPAGAPGGTILEIGPGQGALTVHLLERAARVVAIERDRDLLPVLRATFADAIAEGRLVLIEDDAATVDWAAALGDGPSPRRVAGNVPYNITGRLIERAVQLAPQIDGAVFMVQKEVADRLVAPADSEHYGALSVFVQAAFAVHRALVVRRGAFFPPPQVDSAVVTFTSLNPPLAVETPAFRELVKRAFMARRKTLRNAWKGFQGLTPDALTARAQAAGVSLDARGETLSVADFDRMARGLERLSPAGV